jgi:hypothetical protein
VDLLRRARITVARELIPCAESFERAELAETLRALVDTEIACVRAGPHLAEALSRFTSGAIADRLAAERSALQILFGQVIAVAARRPGSPLPRSQAEFTGRLLSYVKGMARELAPSTIGPRSLRAVPRICLNHDSNQPSTTTRDLPAGTR